MVVHELLWKRNQAWELHLEYEFGVDFVNRSGNRIFVPT